MSDKQWLIYRATFFTRAVDSQTAASFNIKPTGDLVLLDASGTPIKAYAAGTWKRIEERTAQSWEEAVAWYNSL